MSTDQTSRYPQQPNRRPALVLIALAALFALGLLPNREEAADRVRTTPNHLTSRPRPETPAVKPMAIGEEIRTEGGQRRRVQLPGGGVLYVNQNTTVKLNAARLVTLSAGEVFLDVEHNGKDKTGAFVVKTPKDTVTGERARFAVRTAAAGPGVVVARGQVQIGDLKDIFRAGQQRLPGKEKPVPAPRLSHVLDWTRDLMSAAETPLVPGTRHAGGALIAIDPDGQEAKLILRKYHVDVHVEDGFARTTIDQTYFNHEDSRLEGTFYFPLPADASLSRLAMYVDGNLMEGGMAERDYARQVYETIKYRQQDPALLALAWQCWQLEDRPLANHLVRTALDDIPEKKERLPLTLAGIAFFRETGQLANADGLLQKLLADPQLVQRAGLWRLAGQIAEQRDMAARALECLEKALEAEYQNPPDVVDLKAMRQDYDKLLDHYQNLAQAMITLKVKPPPGFLTRVVRAADRWRALDQDGTQACQQAGRILQTLGQRDLSWDYLTTPIGMRPNEASPWVELAQTLSRKGELDLANRAYTAAFETEPTNAQILWDRAQNLRQSGKTVAAQKLFRELAEGKWQPRFQWLQTQARWQVQNR